MLTRRPADSATARLRAGTARLVAGIVIVNARALRADLPGRRAAAPLDA